MLTLADDDLIDLNRRPIVSPVEGDDPVDAAALFDLLAEGDFGEVRWEKLLDERRVILLVGPAHTGKTSELKLLRKRLREANRACFFLDMAVVVRQSVEDALGLEADAFEAWMAEDAEAVILLDALDEAELCDEKALTVCLLRVSRKLSARGVDRCRFVISSRPGAWSTHEVLKEIRVQLAAPARSVRSAEDGAFVLDYEAAEKIAPDALCVASLPYLKPPQLDRLLRQVHGVSDPVSLRQRAWQLGLRFALKSPGSLDWLTRAVSAIGDRPAGRREGLEAAVREQAHAAFRGRAHTVRLSVDEFVCDLERLCAAAHFGQTYMFALHEAKDPDGAMSLRELLAHREVVYEGFVHSSPFFIDAGLQRIKWSPDELLPFLAARWLAKRIARSELSSDEVFEQLFLQSTFTGEIVPSQLEVTAGWLASMDANFARRLISVAPHAAFLYGDLGKLPLEIACGAFAATKKALLDGQALFFRTVRTTPDDFHQAMRPELTKAVVAAFDEAEGNLDALDLLIRLVTSRGVPEAVPALRKLLAKPDVSEHNLPRLVDALGECGKGEDIEWAVDDLFRTNRMSKRVVTRAFESLLQRSTSVDHLRRVIDTGGLDEIAASLFADDRILDEPDKHAAFAVFERLLAASVTREVSVDGESADDEDDIDDDAGNGRMPFRVLASGLRALLARHDLDEADFGQLVAWLERLRRLRPGRDHDLFEDIVPLVAEHTALRELALRRLLAAVRTSDLPLLAYYKDAVYAIPAADDIPLIRSVLRNVEPEDRRHALERLIERIEPRPAAPSPPVRRRKELQASAEAIAKVKRSAETLRTCANINSLLELMQGVFPDDEQKLRRRWRELEETFGPEVREAVQQGLRQLWRTHPPWEQADRPNDVFARTVAGLLGLNEELSERVVVERLSDAEATRALEYSLFNANSFSKWVNDLIENRFALCDAFYGATIAAWETSPAALRHARDTIAWIPPCLAKDGPQVRAAAWAFLRSGDWEGQPGLERLLEMLCRNAEDPALATELPGCAQLAWHDRLEGWVPLVTAWTRVQPATAVPFLARESADAERHGDLITLANYWSLHDEFPLEGHSDVVGLAEYLEQLYVLISTAAPPEGDVYRVGVYSPSPRDNAAQMRSALLTMIEKVGGYAAYAAFTRLAHRFRVDREDVKVFVTFATKVAEAAALPAKWSTSEFVTFANDVAQLPVSSEQALWKRVTRDIGAIVRNVQHGRHHVGQMLGRGQERDMQLWMARELELHARGSYGVARENELANRTMPDLIADAAGKQITLELKVADDRKVSELLDDLEHQLLNDYMGDVRSNFGLFVVMVRNPNKQFLHKGRRLGVPQLRTALQARSDALSKHSMGRNTVAVIVFALTKDTRAKWRRQRLAK